MTPGIGRASPGAEPEVVDAVVHAGSAEIPFRRAGRGPAVLLLADAAGPAVDALVRSLARNRLVVQPTALPWSGEWAAWLTAIVEGLGLASPEVVAGSAARPHVETFARSHPGWVGRIHDIEGIDR